MPLLTSQVEADTLYTVTTQLLSTLTLISVAAHLFSLGYTEVIRFFFRQRQVIKSKETTQEATTGMTLVFHWSYIMLPMAILLLSIILTASFYHRLPAEVAYRFKSDGSPGGLPLSRGTLILWVLLAQLFLTLLATAISWGTTKLGSLFRQPEGTWIKSERILFSMERS